MVKTLNKVIYKAHIKYMDHMDRVEVRRKLTTFSSDPSVL
jgi:hypothetical protein